MAARGLARPRHAAARPASAETVNRLARKFARQARRIEWEWRQAAQAARWRDEADARERHRQALAGILEDLRKEREGLAATIKKRHSAATPRRTR